MADLVVRSAEELIRLQLHDAETRLQQVAALCNDAAFSIRMPSMNVGDALKLVLEARDIALRHR